MSLASALLAVALLVANGFFVAAEFALLASRRSRLEQLAAAGDRRAAKALAGIRELSLMLAAAQLGITMASLGLGAVAEPALAGALERVLGSAPVPPAVRHTIAFAVALSVVVFLHVVLGEMVPKSWAISHPERSALRLVPPFRAFALVFRPAIRVLNALANGVVRLCGVTPQDELAMTHSPTDLILLLQESAEHGTLEVEQTILLARALELPDLDAQAAMVPRRDIVCVSATASIDELERIAAETGRSRLPVHGGDLDRFIGILHVKDLLDLSDDERTGTTAETLARPALVTPESRPLMDLMLDMREQRQHVALVVDEYGSVSGLVALEDVIEELIGEFEDESDRTRQDGSPQFPRRADGALLVPGTLRPDELEVQISLSLPEGDYETIAGFVISKLGRLPAVGDVVRFGGSRLEVTQVERHRLVELAIHPPADANARGPE
ncbi:MAG: hemolysin family protein [Egibacteraceae bacterium]